MRIGIDARFAVRSRRGIGNYSLKLIQNLALIDSGNEYVLYTDRDDSEGVLPNTMNFKTRRISPPNYLLWEQISLPLQARRDGIDILHCTGNTAPILLDRRIKLITTIHDVMYLKDYCEVPKSASLYQRLGRLYRRTIVPRAVRHRPMLLTVSEFSKYDILKHIPKLDKERVQTIHEAANEKYRRIDKNESLREVSRTFNVNGRYILTLGAVDPRKNTELVIRTFLELKREEGIKEKLLIVGIPHWKQTRFYGMVQGCDFRDDIAFTDFVSEDDLVILYNGATLFLYPSLYEGFGIPPLEAMACGVPVISSRTTSIPEIVGDAALLIDPRSGKELKEALMKLLNEEALRNRLIARGLEQAKKFSWMRLAENTLAAYRQVYIGNRTMVEHSGHD